MQRSAARPPECGVRVAMGPTMSAAGGAGDGSNDGDGSPPRPEAIIVIGGSFSPPHTGHLAALKAGKRKAEGAGWTVVAGYLACAHDSHVRSKLRGRGQDASQALSAATRLQMCNAIAAESDWLRPTPRTFGSARDCGQAMIAAQHPPRTRIVAVKGRDLPALTTTKDGRELSSSLVRHQIKVGGSAGVRALAKAGALPWAVASKMEEHVLAGAEPEPEPEPELALDPDPDLDPEAPGPEVQDLRALVALCQTLYRRAAAGDAAAAPQLATTATTLLRHHDPQPVALLSLALLNARAGRDAEAAAGLRSGLAVLRARGREDGPVGVEMRRQLATVVGAASVTQQQVALPRTLSTRERQARMLAETEAAVAEADTAASAAKLAVLTRDIAQLRLQFSLQDAGFQCAGGTWWAEASGITVVTAGGGGGEAEEEVGLGPQQEELAVTVDGIHQAAVDRFVELAWQPLQHQQQQAAADFVRLLIEWAQAQRQAPAPGVMAAAAAATSACQQQTKRKTKRGAPLLVVEPLPRAMGTRLRAMQDESEAASVVGRDHRDREARAARSAIAMETLAWCEQGYYYSSEGEPVDVPVQAAIDATVLITADSVPRPTHAKTAGVCGGTVVHIVEAGVIAMAEAALSVGERVGVLNFASARNPGGGFKKGANAQEEALARCTALYSCLTSPAASRYYTANSDKAVCGIYTDAIIYSPNVPLLRHESGTPLGVPLELSIVTCPAPNLGAMGAEHATEARAVLRWRMEKVLAVFAAAGVDTIVLGAWGCGVFKHDPAHVAADWRKLLETRFAGAFGRVIFAVLGQSFVGFVAGFGQ